ncbi:MAG: hypothetical protein KF702_11070 [Gammaproteobacteria bacterium]|nr:hypothetical protein [Gammaproteobacteria bacterium]
MFALLRILDFSKVKLKQKITFIRVGLGIIMLALFIFILSRFYPSPVLEIVLSTQFINQKILPDPSSMVFKH